MVALSTPKIEPEINCLTVAPFGSKGTYIVIEHKI